MKKKLNVLVVIMLVSILFDHRIIWGGEVEDYNFYRLAAGIGLSQSTVNDILQDSSGYLWFGTEDGLNRFDGRVFDVYRYEKDNPESIANSKIKDIEEDHLGNLWVATEGGLSKINTRNGSITNYYHSKKDNKSLGNNFCTAIFIDSSGRVWIGTNEGVSLYDSEKDNFTNYRIKENINEHIDSDNFHDANDKFSYSHINSITEDGNGRIWIGAHSGLYYFCEEEEMLKSYGYDGKCIYEVEYTSDGELWIGMTNNGISILDMEESTKRYISYDKGNKDGLQSNIVNDIMECNNGDIWVSTDKGLSKYVGEDKFITYKNLKHDNESIISDQTLSLYQSKSGSIWVGTEVGISIFNPNQPFHHYRMEPFEEYSITSDMISGIYEDEDGLVWIGTFNDGLNCMNRETGEIINYTVNDGENSISSNNIRQITGDKNGTIWVATEYGLNKIDKNTGEVEVYQKQEGDNSIISNYVQSLYYDSKGTLWIGTLEGVCKLDEKGNFTSYVNEFIEAGVYDRDINCIYEDYMGNIWVGTSESGDLIKINSGNMIDKIEAINIEAGAINSIVRDAYSNLWLGTSQGLIKYNIHNQRVATFTEEDGLSNNYIYGIVMDDMGQIWMSTNSGICKFIFEEVRFVHYGIFYGIQDNEFNEYAYAKGADGEIYFGGINGLNVFNPKKLNSYDRLGAKVDIKSCKVNGVEAGDGKEIELPYNGNNISLEFFFPDFRSVNETTYMYKMKGIDDGWVTSKSRDYVNYVNLPPGEYDFLVMAKEVNGEWSDPTTMKFKINNPPWKTPYAYGLYILCAIAAVLAVIHYFRKLDRLVALRTKELSDKMEENEKLYEQLISNERYKNNYFINLSHELRTPLNVILTAEQLISSINKEPEHIPKSKLDYYMEVLKRNSNRLLKLINNIIDTSKIESGSYKLEYEDVDIVYLTEEVALSMKEFIEEKGIDLVIDPEIEELQIECDQTDIERCIVNIIGNAVKFTEEGGNILVNVTEDEESAIISISDNGIGIEQEHMESIFDRFSQLYNQTSEVYGGSGLGLTLTKQLVELHHGTINVESEVGVGSTFTMRLPKSKQNS